MQLEPDNISTAT